MCEVPTRSHVISHRFEISISISYLHKLPHIRVCYLCICPAKRNFHTHCECERARVSAFFQINGWMHDDDDGARCCCHSFYWAGDYATAYLVTLSLFFPLSLRHKYCFPVCTFYRGHTMQKKKNSNENKNSVNFHMGNTIRNTLSYHVWDGNGRGGRHTEFSVHPNILCVDRSYPFTYCKPAVSRTCFFSFVFSFFFFFYIFVLSCHRLHIALANKTETGVSTGLHCCCCRKLSVSNGLLWFFSVERQKRLPLICQVVSFQLLQPLIYWIINIYDYIYAASTPHTYYAIECTYVWCHSVSNICSE